MNGPTIIIAAIVAVIFVAIVVNGIRNKRKGKSSCGCSCEGCGMGDACHKQK